MLDATERRAVLATPQRLVERDEDQQHAHEWKRREENLLRVDGQLPANEEPEREREEVPDDREAPETPAADVR